MVRGQQYLHVILDLKYYISCMKFICPTTVCSMLFFGMSHTKMLTTSTHCRHINQLPHDPILLSTASLSKNKLYKYQESEEISQHAGTKPVYSSQGTTQYHKMSNFMISANSTH